MSLGWKFESLRQSTSGFVRILVGIGRLLDLMTVCRLIVVLEMKLIIVHVQVEPTKSPESRRVNKVDIYTN